MDDQEVHHGEDKREIVDYLFDFHCYYGREDSKAYTSKEHKTEYWIDQVDRCELDLVSPRVVYWTTRGRVTRIKITPPHDKKKLDSCKKMEGRRVP